MNCLKNCYICVENIRKIEIFFSEPMERTTTTSIVESDQIDFFSVRSGFQEKSSKCSVIEDISGQSKTCKFPFVLRNETFYGCTSTGRNRSIIFITYYNFLKCHVICNNSNKVKFTFLISLCILKIALFGNSKWINIQIIHEDIVPYS